MRVVLNIPQPIYSLFLDWIGKYPQIKILSNPPKTEKEDRNNNVHIPYIATHTVLSQDWDSPEDDHWDNY